MKWGMLFIAIFLAGSFFFAACTKKPAAPVPVSFDWDKGPLEIDAQVAKYPKDLQAAYNNVIKAKCTQCHPLARALWAPYYDGPTWTKIVSKMANRPGSQVTSEDVAGIVKFFTYDHARRKPEIEKMFQDNRWQPKEPVGLQ